MKKLFLIVIFIYGGFVIKAQTEAGGELIIWIINNPGGAEIKIEVQLVSSLCWDAWIDYPNLHNKTNLYNVSYLTTTLNNKDLNWEACWSSPGYQYAFGLGNYKVTAYQKINGQFEQKDYFYIDYRTSDLPEHFNSGGQGDLNVDFNVGTSSFYYSGTQYLFPISTSIWEQKSWIYDIKTELEPLAPENLYYVNYNDHPKLIWSNSSNPGDYVTNYEVHRKIHTGDWIKIVTQSSALLWYVDNEINLSTLSTSVSYKIRAKNSTRTSDQFSNTIIISSYHDFGELPKEQAMERNNAFIFRLDQNYPNPFNSTTNIRYSIPQSGIVTLKVYDLMGSEVAILLDRYQEMGSYDAIFQADNLASGIYFYEIKANNFRDVKKLILLE